MVLAANMNERLCHKLYFDKKKLNLSCDGWNHQVDTNLPVRAFGIGQRLTRQPEVAFLKSKAGQQLRSLRLEFVEVALFDRGRGQEHRPLWKLRHCRGKNVDRKKKDELCVFHVRRHPV